MKKWGLLFFLLLSITAGSFAGALAQNTTSKPKPSPLSLPAVNQKGGTWEIRSFEGGLNLKAFPTELKDNEAQVLNNAIWDRFGALRRRKGWTHFSIPDSTIPITGLYRYYQQDGTRYLMVAGDTALYRAKDDSTSFVKIKSDLSSGDFHFVNYKDYAVIAHPNMITVGYDGSSIWNLGIIDTLRAESIYVSSCSTNYKLNQIKGWITDQYAGYLLYNPLNKKNLYSIIAGNSSDRIYTYADGNLLENYGFEVTDEVSPGSQVSMHWHRTGGDVTRTLIQAHTGSYSLVCSPSSGEGTARQIVKEVQDSAVYTFSFWEKQASGVDGYIQVTKGDGSTVLLQIIVNGGAYGHNWTQHTDTFYTDSEDSVWVYLMGSAGNTFFDDISIERKYYRYPNADLLLLNWFNVGTAIQEDTLDSVVTDNCRDYLYGITEQDWSNDFIIFTSGNAKGQGGLVRNLNHLTTIEPALEPVPLTGEKATYKIYPQTFWQSYYCAVFHNRLVLAKDSLNGNLCYYSDVNLWSFPPANFFSTFTNDGDIISGLMPLYNDQFGQRASPNDRLLIFKTNNILATASDFIPYVVTTGVGAVATNSIVNVEGMFVGFAHTSGYYITDGNQVTRISEKIKPFWDKINKQHIDKIACGYYPEIRSIFCSVPYDTSTTNDTGLIYNIDNKGWSTANLKASVLANQWGLQDTIKFLWGRPDKGWICRYGTSDFDNASDTITLTYKSKEFDGSDLFLRKDFNEIGLAYSNSLPLTLNFYTDYGSTASWSQSMTTTGSQINHLLISPEISGRTLAWGLTSEDPSISLGAIQIKWRLIGRY